MSERFALALLVAASCAGPAASPAVPLARHRTKPPVCATHFQCSEPRNGAHAPGAASAPRASAVPATSAQPGTRPPENTATLLAGGGARSVSGIHGVVTSAEANATRAGIEILEAGGNAADAAVAVAAALAVTHPNAGNLGGGGFALVRRPGGPTVALDFREAAPQSLTRAEFDAMIAAGGFGPSAVGVPGTVAGLVALEQRFGTLPLGRVLAPAIALARNGHALGAHPARLLARAWPSLEKDPAARAIFGDAGHSKPAGALLVQADLAGTLERVARFGQAGFYGGETARSLRVATGGRLSDADLARYQAVERAPLAFSYRGLELETMPPPSAGGPTLAGILRALESLRAHELPVGSAAEAHLFVEVSRRAQALRRLSVVDPDATSIEERNARLAPFLDPATLLKVPIDPEHATPSGRIHPLYPDALRETEHTTHLSVVDRDGMVVSLTTTLSASFGARLLAPGTGVLLNNAVASFSSIGENQPAAGRRTTSSMAPTLVLQGGKPVLVLGTPGGDTIPSTLAQLVENLVDRGMPLDVAVDAPRLHHGFVPDAVRYEVKRPPSKAVLAGLAKLGHHLLASPLVQGDANCILLQDAHAFGYADPREPGGSALAVP